MRIEKQASRRQEIEAAAYDLLAVGGYQGTTMQAVAQRAGASMETLYRWYGDKRGLFQALVARNTHEVRAVLEGSLAEGTDPQAALATLGPRLLALLLGERAVALNRAAAADGSGELGAAIGAAGRNSVLPLIAQLFAGIGGCTGEAEPGEIAETYINLLVGDLQIRRVIGNAGPLEPDACAARAERAQRLIIALFFAELTPRRE